MMKMMMNHNGEHDGFAADGVTDINMTALLLIMMWPMMKMMTNHENDDVIVDFDDHSADVVSLSTPPPAPLNLFACC